MRVIAGEAKGRKLRSVVSGSVRPSKDRLKEGLFSSIGPRVAGSVVLDLYAGSGALGIEALSRGAAHATFVESGRDAAQMIRDNLESTKLAARAEVVEVAAERFLWETTRRFDIVLIDPPYELGLPSGVLDLLRQRDLLVDAALVAVEVESRRLPLEAPAGFELRSERRYGDSAVLYLEVVP